MVSYGDRPNDYDSISNCVFLPALFPDLGFISIQILGINSAPSTNLTPPTESENYTVSLLRSKFASSTIVESTTVHLTSVTDTRRTHTIISSGKLTLHFAGLSTSLTVLLPSSRLHFEIESEDGRLHVIPASPPSS